MHTAGCGCRSLTGFTWCWEKANVDTDSPASLSRGGLLVVLPNRPGVGSTACHDSERHHDRTRKDARRRGERIGPDRRI